ncbi:ribonuclease H family protein [Ureaplasma ceti]|uniref:ribonuclease H n=1 Tax=Ureaplasma ceti TaxID=3119530 RepID=A0ABP9U4Y1_9BACT
MTKFYAVKKGTQTGVFETWDECQNSIKGFKGADYKAFISKEEAQAYLTDRDIWVEQVQKDNQDGYLVAFTDGSYNKELNRYGYGVQLIKSNGEEENICGSGSNEKYLPEKNVAGEAFGVINALDWAISNNYDKLKIYHDYEGLNKWLTGEWTPKSNVAKMYTNLFESKFKALLQVEFVKIKGHSNIVYNDKADALAKMALNDKYKNGIMGDNWFTIPYFKLTDFYLIKEKVTETYNNILIELNDEHANKQIYKFKNKGEKITITLFDKGQLLLQGKHSPLFQTITSIIIEVCSNIKVEEILSSAYRTNIDKDSFIVFMMICLIIYPKTILMILKDY